MKRVWTAWRQRSRRLTCCTNLGLGSYRGPQRKSRSDVMRGRLLWPLAIVLGALAALDAVLWFLAAHASGTDRAGLVSSASALLVAVVGVGGTAVGAYLTAEYSRGTARMADRRA